MKYSALLLFLFSVFAWGSVIPVDAEVVRPQACGHEQRNDQGYLLPLAAMNPIDMPCGNCTLEVTFDVPAIGGFPEHVETNFSGMSSANAQKLVEIFSSSWAFPYCLESGKKSGFKREVWRFVGPA
ncbi:hypothetical protein [Photobacterium halotolerans]|uniref:hypothetical protein n=1 Tax=Photobacterium halotolerans TaxID=265726 RepID=UPI00048591A1|nr:hypothetical protein [Photobacterium halotolerans]